MFFLLNSFLVLSLSFKNNQKPCACSDMNRPRAIWKQDECLCGHLGVYRLSSIKICLSCRYRATCLCPHSHWFLRGLFGAVTFDHVLVEREVDGKGCVGVSGHDHQQTLFVFSWQRRTILEIFEIRSHFPTNPPISSMMFHWWSPLLPFLWICPLVLKCLSTKKSPFWYSQAIFLSHNTSPKIGRPNECYLC